MADEYGAISLPIAPPQVGFSPADPLLDYTLLYLQAVINSYATAAWQSIAPGTLPVKTISANDPEEVDFNERDLPTLYAFRTGATEEGPQWEAEDIWLMHDQVMLFWVMPPARQAFRAFREQITAGVAKSIHWAIEQGRHPAWILKGDTDPQAATYGSVFPRFAGFVEMYLRKWEDRMVRVEVDGAPRRSYPAFYGVLHVTEELVEDVTKPIYPPFATNAGLDQKVFDKTGTLLINERIT